MQSPKKESLYFDEDFLKNLKNQSDANNGQLISITGQLVSVNKEISDVRDVQKTHTEDLNESKLLLHQCVNDITWLKKIFWALLVLSGGTFISTFAKVAISMMQK